MQSSIVGSVDTAIKAYSVQTATNALPISTVTYPQPYYGCPVATDSSGQTYVAVAPDPVNPANLGDVFIYPPNSAGQATPSRTIQLSSYAVCALTVDANGLLYVAINPGPGTQTIAVYSATANGDADPLRALALTNFKLITDIAADAAGNIYVAGLSVNGNGTIAVYSPVATGATPDRAIGFSNSGL